MLIIMIHENVEYTSSTLVSFIINKTSTSLVCQHLCLKQIKLFHIVVFVVFEKFGSKAL